MDNYFDIGKIVNTQGIKGDVRVIPYTYDPKRFELLDSVEIFLRDYRLCLVIESVRYHKNFVILKLSGVDSMNDGEKLKDGIIRVPAERALPLDDNEYYLRDLYDMDVYCGDEYLGKITDVLHTGANDVYVVRNGKQEILLPAILQCIHSVSVKENKMMVELMEGMR